MRLVNYNYLNIKILFNIEECNEMNKKMVKLNIFTVQYIN